MFQNVTALASQVLLTLTRSTFTTYVNFFHHFAPTLLTTSHSPPPPPPPPKLVIYKLYINFYQYKLVLFLFSHLLASTDLIILLGPMLQALIYCLCLFLHDLHRLNLLCQVICLS